MTLSEFAEKHKLRLKCDDCRDQFVPGKRGQIFDHADGCFGVMILDASLRTWNSIRRKMVTAGFRIIQDGDEEGTALFDPADRRQAKIAIRTIRARRKRQGVATPEVLERLRRARESRRMPVAA